MDKLLSAFNLSSEMIFFFTLLSLLTFLFSLILLPILVLAIPEDYFVDKQRHAMSWNKSGYLLKLIVLLLKNCLGVLLFFMGVLMLVLPGQGILTLLAGLVLLDFPGKFQFMRWLAHKDRILKSLNWIRKKGNKEPFVR